MGGLARPLIVFSFVFTLWAQPPPVVAPGNLKRGPSDAVHLFNGKNMDGWASRDGASAKCTVQAGVMECASGAGDTFTKSQFQSGQFHIEFQVPYMPQQKDQLRGNSGVFLQGRYEIQVLDSWENPTYANGMLGAIYGQKAPDVNAARKPMEWQSFDIVFRAARCSGDTVVAKPRVTVLLNNVLIHDHVEIEKPGTCEAGPLLLQDHSGFPGAPFTTMRFRNIWYRPLAD